MMCSQDTFLSSSPFFWGRGIGGRVKLVISNLKSFTLVVCGKGDKIGHLKCERPHSVGKKIKFQRTNLFYPSPVDLTLDGEPKTSLMSVLL